MAARRKKKRETDVRVLLADDDNDTVDLLKLLLKREGWEVIAAKDGREALELYEKAVEDRRYFDVLLLDVAMPEINGIAVGVNVRKVEDRGDAPRAAHIYHSERVVSRKIAEPLTHSPSLPRCTPLVISLTSCGSRFRYWS